MPCEEVVGWQAMVMAWPNSLCGQRYPASGQEGHNNLIEKVVAVEVLSVTKTKTKRVLHCELAVAWEKVVG